MTHLTRKKPDVLARWDHAAWLQKRLGEARGRIADLEDELDRYQSLNSPHNRETAPRRENVRGHDTTEVPVMPKESNDLKVRVAYTTTCPEWWRIQIRKHLGGVGLATRAECIEWLRRYGESQDNDLWLTWDAWQKAAADGEEVEL